jgi:phosphatidylglycerol phospholipase C
VQYDGHPHFVNLILLPHEQPENQHIKFNIDVKVFNEPDRVFSLMNKIITSYPEWETKLTPRIILGLWHPRFIKAAKTHVPYFKRSHIGFAPDIARKYFWNECDAFSMWFPGLATADGEK